ncbi:mechanosensitive ion channel family protein [Candidatus Sororendozoicomonas aggregata]|uniref:mechanosensitive ion channel family protein n=1 Tax=Candidatus Sororendozoicomonas aggregata TaxID=3073239 RepID=UPI002ED65CD3
MGKNLQSYTLWGTQALIIIVVAAALGYLARHALSKFSLRIDNKKTPYLSALLLSVKWPLNTLILVLAIGWSLSLSAFNFPVFEAIPLIQRLITIVILAWFFLSFINHSYQHLEEMTFSHSAFDANTAGVIYKFLQLLICIVAGLMLLQSAGVSISSLLAFGGIGGLAVGLAAKDMLANLFGGLALYMDRPFRVGEKIKVMGTDIEGWVQDIGWRKTRVLNYDRQPTYVPNALFGNSAVINPSRITNRKIRQLIGIRYQDLDLVRTITEKISRYINNHPDIDKKRPIEVRLVEYSASSLNILIYCFVACKDFEEMLKVQEDILLTAGEIIHACGADIAFPTRTLDVQWPSANDSKDT